LLAERERDDAGAVATTTCPKATATSSNDRMPSFGRAAEERVPVLAPAQIGLIVDWL